MERLDKLVASQTGITRKQARERIWQGAVTVNGVKEKLIDRKVDEQRDEVCLDGKPLCYRDYLYIMLNKPQDCISASRGRDERTVLDLLPTELRRSGLFPAGRLDKDTEGLIIITDDGDFAHRLTSPTKHVTKVYIARLDEPVAEDAPRAFAEGITLADGDRCRPARLTLSDNGATARVEVCEGKYHQVKRMIASQGGHVAALRRISVGSLVLDESLAPGQCRLMEKEEAELATRDIG